MPIRTTLRALLRSPWFTATAVATIALGIGANLTVFSLVNRVLLAPLPYRDADRLVWIATWHSEQSRYSKTAGFDVDAWRQQTALFDSVQVYWDRPFTITGTDRPEGIVGQQFSPGHFTMLGTPAALGRTLLESDGDPARSDVVVLSDGFWRHRFAARPDVVGQPLELDGRRYTVVGVMPPAFAHPNGLTDVWVPVVLSRRELDDRKQRPFRVVARLRDGVTPARAEHALRALAVRHASEFPDTHAGFSVSLRPLREVYVGDVSTLLWIIQGTAAILLIIASANVASLVLVRASGRQRETAVRIALGAGPGHLLRHHITEGLVLAGAGGALGMLIAAWGARVLPDLLASARGVTLTTATDNWVDGRVLLAAVVATLAAAVMFGITPLMRGRDALSLSLRTGMKGATADRRTRAIRQAIVAGQVALSVMLLVGAGLLIRSFVSLQSRGFGFEPDGVTTAQLVLPRDRYATTGQSAEFLRQLVAETSALPGVQSAAAVNTLPLTGFNALRPHFLPGRQPAQERFAEFRVVTPDYFRTMTIPLQRGRVFDDNDRLGAQEVVVVNETLARRMWPGFESGGRRSDGAGLRNAGGAHRRRGGRRHAPPRPHEGAGTRDLSPRVSDVLAVFRSGRADGIGAGRDGARAPRRRRSRGSERADCIDSSARHARRQDAGVAAIEHGAAHRIRARGRIPGVGRRLQRDGVQRGRPREGIRPAGGARSRAVSGRGRDRRARHPARRHRHRRRPCRRGGRRPPDRHIALRRAPDRSADVRRRRDRHGRRRGAGDDDAGADGDARGSVGRAALG